jgi:CDP-paratose 2-epimerase
LKRFWLVTGGCGFLGTNLVASLLHDGVPVIAIDNLERAGSESNLSWLTNIDGDQGLLRFERTDLRDAEGVDRVVATYGTEIDTVAHLGGQVAMTRSMADPVLDFEVNSRGSLNILEALRRTAPDAYAIFASTNKVYGELGRLPVVETQTRWQLADIPEGIDESTTLSFETPYGCSKGAADQYFLDYSRSFGLNTVVFRHGSIYGRRQFATIDQGWLAWFCLQATRQFRAARAGVEPEPFTISGDGKQVRDLLNVADAVRAYRLLRERWPGRAQVFNIGGGPANAMSLIELFGELERRLEITLRYTHLPARARDQKVYVSNVKRAKDMFGWAPTIRLSEGIDEMLRWSEELDPVRA